MLGRMQTQHTGQLDNSLCQVQCGWSPGHPWVCGRVARAGTETRRKALCPYLSGDSRVGCAYFSTFSSIASESN